MELRGGSSNLAGRPYFVLLRCGIVFWLAAFHGAAVEPAHTPVVVELFTSEGCSSCPAADQLLAYLDKTQPLAEAEIVVLGEHVDYWDQLGWKDRFSSRLFTARQQTYAHVLAVEDVYTPQMVVNGQAEFNGADAQRAIQQVRRAAALPHATVNLARKDDSALALQVSRLPAGSKDVEILLAITENDLATDVRRGENSGRRLTHAGVVRSLVPVARFDPRKTPEYASDLPLTLEGDWNRSRLSAIVIVQDHSSRKIVGAARLGL